MNKNPINKNSIVGILIIAVILVGAALGIHYNFVRPEGGFDENGSQDWDFESIDSSYCIDCHTSESIIAASTYNEDNPPAEDTGG